MFFCLQNVILYKKKARNVLFLCKKMELKKEMKVEKSLMVEAADQNCYEYLIECTEGYGEYKAVQHMDKITMRSEFLHDVDCFAAYMKNELGLRRGDVYTVFMPTTVQSIVSFYALNKIGVIVNFVHPQLPPEVLKEAIEDCNSKGVMILDLLSKDYVGVINESGLPCVVCSSSDYAAPVKEAACKAGEGLLKAIFPKLNKRVSYREVISKYPPEPGLVGNADDIAVYLHGGGTTGKSKVIKLTSRAINELACRVSKLDKIEDPGEEAEVIVLPLFHCFGLCIGIHMAMCNAGRIIPLMQFDAGLFTKLMRKNRVIAVVGIPVMFKKLMKHKHFDGPWLKNIRMMFCGGDDCSDAFLDEFNAVLEKNGAPGKLRQGYGLTEVGSVCTVNSNTKYKRGSIGWPLEGLRVEIWDDNNKKLPDGEIGEIVISGPTIMEGYYRPGCEEHEGLYIDEEGTKWVKSGDLGYRDSDNYFYFAGRKKRVVIISGYNVYPIDIEKFIQDTFPEIKGCCLVKGYSPEGKILLRLFLSVKDGTDKQALEKEIIRQVGEHFSEFSVPREFRYLNTMPETPLMKIDFMLLTQNKPEDKVYSEE